MFALRSPRLQRLPLWPQIRRAFQGLRYVLDRLAALRRISTAHAVNVFPAASDAACNFSQSSFDTRPNCRGVVVYFSPGGFGGRPVCGFFFIPLFHSLEWAIGHAANAER